MNADERISPELVVVGAHVLLLPLQSDQVKVQAKITHPPTHSVTQSITPLLFYLFRVCEFERGDEAGEQGVAVERSRYARRRAAKDENDSGNGAPFLCSSDRLLSADCFFYSV